MEKEGSTTDQSVEPTTHTTTTEKESLIPPQYYEWVDYNEIIDTATKGTCQEFFFSLQLNVIFRINYLKLG